MSAAGTLPGLLHAFFKDRLMQQRQASAHTVASYRDAFRLLLQYAKQRPGKAPSNLTVPELDTPLIGAFLDQISPRSWRRGSSSESSTTYLGLPAHPLSGHLRAPLYMELTAKESVFPAPCG